MSGTRTKTRMNKGPAVAAQSGIRTRATAWTGIAVSVVGALLVLAVPGRWPALAGALLLACVPAGAAVMCWLDSGDGVVQAGLTLVLSLAMTAILSAVMIWLKAWHPGALLGLAVVSSTVCGRRLVLQGGAVTAGRDWAVPWRATGMRDLLVRLAPLFLGLGAWAYGVSQIRRQAIGLFGLLASANIWFLLGLVVLLAGGLLELSRREPRPWLLGAYLTGLIVAIHATIPMLYGVPEYGWVYKHIGIVQALGTYGRVTDPSNIYQQWPSLFAAVASVSRLSRVGPLSFAAWAPLAFELADALLLLGIFRLIAGNRRVVYLALFLYEGLMAWIGQDYLSPQAFGYLLWLGIAAILFRWLMAPAPTDGRRRLLSRARAPFLVQLSTPPESTSAQRAVAGILVTIIFFAIVTAHQLTPYLVLAGIGALVLLGLLRRGWLVLLMMAVIAGGYLALRYHLIAQQYGGLFSGGSVLQNASGEDVYHPGAEAMTAEICHYLAIAMWLLALAAIARQWRTLGQVAVVALLAFSPFLIIFAQSYGGEAIARVYMFSAPWCALLIAGLLIRLRVALSRWLIIAAACALALAAGLQGLYGPIAYESFTPAGLTASLWLYGHAPHSSVIVLADDDWPAPATANYNDYNLQYMPADPSVGHTWLNEANVPEVQKWLGSFGHHDIYVVFSRSMATYADYFGAPHGYTQLVNAAPKMIGWSVVYRNADTTIYGVNLYRSHEKSQN